jgi:predicted PurR-regulated permease PerM
VVASSRHQDNSKRNLEYVPDSASGLYERSVGSFLCVFFLVFFLFLEGREASEHRSVAAALVRHSG